MRQNAGWGCGRAGTGASRGVSGLGVRIMVARESQTASAPPRAWKAASRWFAGALVPLVVVVAPLAGICAFLLLQPSEVPDIPRGTPEEVAYVARQNRTLHIVGRYRAADRTSPCAVNAANDFVPVEIWARDAEVRMHIGDPGWWLGFADGQSFSLHDSRNGFRGAPWDAHCEATLRWFLVFARWQYIFFVEMRMAAAGLSSLEVQPSTDGDAGGRAVAITCRSGGGGECTGSNAYGLKSMFEPYTVREYQADGQSKVVRSMEVRAGAGADGFVVLETSLIEYGADVPAEFIRLGKPAGTSEGAPPSDFFGLQGEGASAGRGLRAVSGWAGGWLSRGSRTGGGKP